MIEVAIACENSDTDGEIYRHLLELILDCEVATFAPRGHHRFSGWKSVYRLAPSFIALAADAGVRHALLVVDNDGGAKKHPEHADTDAPLPRGTPLKELIESKGCRTCSLAALDLRGWRSSGRSLCIVVPVQAVETWVLFLKEYPFKAPTPEKEYHRRHLKSICYGKQAPAEEQVSKATKAFSQAGAVDRLMERQSFRRFRECVETWVDSGAEQD